MGENDILQLIETKRKMKRGKVSESKTYKKDKEVISFKI